jgi:hypothetical protein
MNRVGRWGRKIVCVYRAGCVCMEGSKTIDIVSSLHHRSISYPREGILWPSDIFPTWHGSTHVDHPCIPSANHLRDCTLTEVDRSPSILLHTDDSVPYPGNVTHLGLPMYFPLSLFLSFSLSLSSSFVSMNLVVACFEIILCFCCCCFGYPLVVI